MQVLNKTKTRHKQEQQEKIKWHTPKAQLSWAAPLSPSKLRQMASLSLCVISLVPSTINIAILVTPESVFDLRGWARTSKIVSQTANRIRRVNLSPAFNERFCSCWILRFKLAFTLVLVCNIIPPSSKLPIPSMSEKQKITYTHKPK